jgi:hypothetical protein
MKCYKCRHDVKKAIQIRPASGAGYMDICLECAPTVLSFIADSDRENLGTLEVDPKDFGAIREYWI